ncbi:N-acetylmuramoyl-L-alanine amidase [Blastococcus sp. Marseille-P5729]|uniref:N-acetylmuramoyl-L-alanine amidase n=1 Tax=Blastococcus sp. Marseille-P5729 TaxID=2086582 RepID=UPI001F3E03FD|nr:N-acetylmuramoyl-L-alanine amidase [Blastococcus sp. Marseille-P5729]
MKWTPQYMSTIKAATLHHSADGNNYSASDVPRLMRSIYHYQAVTLGWGDIGYNVVVDKFGRAWEGRAGGLDKPVVGAHAGGFNRETFGVSMLGNYDLVSVPGVVQEKVAQLIAWKFGLHGVSPTGTTSLTQYGGGGTTAKFKDGTTVALPTIFGHRDVGNTVCPGRYGYPTLSWIRGRAAELTSQYNLVYDRKMVTNTGGVPVLNNPWSGASVAGQLNAWTEVLAMNETSNGYTKVAYLGAYRWVQTDWLSAAPGVTRAFYTTTSGIPVYLAPGWNQLGTIAVNNIVYADDIERNGYIHIRYGTYGGWIPKQWVTSSIPASAAPTGQPTPTREFVANTSGIMVLSSASWTSPVIGTISQGTVVKAGPETINGLVRIVYGSSGGWVSARWLAANPTPSRTLYTNTNNIPVYFGPDSGFQRLGLLPAGQAVYAGVELEGYVHIVYGKHGGWIPKQWTNTWARTNPPPDELIYTNTGGVPAYSDPSTSATLLGTYGANVPLYADDDLVDGMMHVWYGSSGAWIPAQWTVSNPPAQKSYRTNTGGVPVYLGPGTGYYYAGALAASTAVAGMSAPQNGFIRIQFGNSGGWVPQQWLESPPAGPVVPGVTNTGGVPVYLGPGPGYAHWRTVDAHTNLSLSTTAVNGYLHVQLGDGSSGWISRSWISYNPPTTRQLTAITSGIPVYLGPGPGFARIWPDVSVGTKVNASSTETNGYVWINYGSTGGWVARKWFG